jgi:hypothetical protein
MNVKISYTWHPFPLPRTHTAPDMNCENNKTAPPPPACIRAALEPLAARPPAPSSHPSPSGPPLVTPAPPHHSLCQLRPARAEWVQAAMLAQIRRPDAGPSPPPPGAGPPATEGFFQVYFEFIFNVTKFGSNLRFNLTEID